MCALDMPSRDFYDIQAETFYRLGRLGFFINVIKILFPAKTFDK